MIECSWERLHLVILFLALMMQGSASVVEHNHTTLCLLLASLNRSIDVLWSELSQRPAIRRSAVTLLQGSQSLQPVAWRRQGNLDPLVGRKVWPSFGLCVVKLFLDRQLLCLLLCPLLPDHAGCQSLMQHLPAAPRGYASLLQIVQLTSAVRLASAAGNDGCVLARAFPDIR